MDYPHLQDQAYLKYELKKKLTDILGKTGAKGLSVAVCGENARLGAACAGITSAETCDPIGENTVFWADGLAGPALGYAAFKLQEKGLLDLSEPLCKYLPEPFLPGDRDLPQVTGIMALSHTGGLPMRKSAEGPTKLILPPGKRFSYSALGLLYLQRAVERVTGQDLETYLNDTVFRPFRMPQTSLVWREAFAGNFAYPHDGKGKVNHYIKAEKPNASRYFYTTPSDYCAFLNKLFAPQTSKKYCLSPETLSQMLRPRQRLYGKLQWAAGMGVYDDRWLWSFSDQPGTKALAMVDPAQKIGICICCNSEDRKPCEMAFQELTGKAFSPFREYFGPSAEKALWQTKEKMARKKYLTERDGK